MEIQLTTEKGEEITFTVGTSVVTLHFRQRKRFDFIKKKKKNGEIHANTPQPKLYEDFFCQQAGRALPMFIGERSQKRHGIGSFFIGLGQMVFPRLKTGGKVLLRESVGTCLQVAQEALSGRNFGESMRNRGK